MKKNKIIFLIMLISILLPIKAYAFTGSVSINCGKAKPGTEATCTITGKTDTSINRAVYSFESRGYEGTPIYFNSLTNKSVEMKITACKGAIPDPPTSDDSYAYCALYQKGGYGFDDTFTAVKDTFTIGKMTVKVSASANETTKLILKISGIKFYDTDGNPHNIDEAKGSIEIDNTGNGLKSLKVSNGTMSPAFSASSTGYIVTVNSNTFSITTEKINANDKVTIVNAEDTSKALNASSIKFTPKSGTDKMSVIVSVGSTDGYCETGKNNCNNINYTLTISKSSSATDRTYLIKVVIDGKEVEIKEGEHTYTNIYVKDINKYTVVATVANAKRYTVTTMSGNTETGVYEDTGSGTPYYIMVKDLDCPEETAYMKYAFNLKQSQKTDPPSNPQTGNISIFIITIILVASLIISLDLYRKNIQYYNN